MPTAHYAPQVAVAVAGVTLDPDVVVADLTIRSGRARFDDGLEPATTTIDILSASVATQVTVGQDLQVVVDGGPRFTGRVAEVTRAAAGIGQTMFTVSGAGGIARMGRILVALPLPAQSARDRCVGVLEAAGYVAECYGGDAYPLAAYGAPGDAPDTLAAVLSAAMSDTGVVIADQPDGRVLVQFPDSRLSADRFAPAPEATHVDLEWVQTDDLVNDCTVEWVGGAAVEATSPTSIDEYDLHTLRISTNLADVGSATRRATSLVARLALPVWECGDVETWDPGIRDHGIGALITLAPLPDSAPVAGDSWTGVMEGWQDHYAPAADGSGLLAGTWDLSLSDPRKSAEVVVWSGVDPASLAWSQVIEATAWNEAVSNGDLSDLDEG